MAKKLRYDALGNIRCSKCNIFKKSCNFKYLIPKESVWYVCVDCHNLQRRKIYKLDPKRHIGYANKHYHANKTKILERTKKYREEYPDRIKLAHKKWKLTHSKHKVLRRKRDLAYRIKENLRTRIHHALSGLVKKSDKTMNLIGCSFEELRKHIEDQFQSGMSWNNYGNWQIDHIKPCSLFNLKLEVEQRKCFHYTNLQPLWKHDNLVKNNKYEEFSNSTNL